MAQANIGTQREFNHKTYTTPDGTILYDAPFEVEEISNLQDFNATPADIVTLTYNGTDRVKVIFYKTDNLELAQYQWSYLDEKHNQRMRDSRCMVPGRKGMVICNKKNNCHRCPYGRKIEEKQRNTISWDRLISAGYEPAMNEPIETQVIRRIELKELQARMDTEDKRLWQALWLKEIYGDSVQEIADNLNISEPMVYKLIQRAKEVAKAYRKERNE